jgi:hypothetical protein
MSKVKTLEATARKYARRTGAAKRSYREAMRPILAALSRVILPRRYPKGDPRNYRRVQITCAATHQARVAQWPAQIQRLHKKECSTCHIRVRRKKADA